MGHQKSVSSPISTRVEGSNISQHLLLEPDRHASQLLQSYSDEEFIHHQPFAVSIANFFEDSNLADEPIDLMIEPACEDVYPADVVDRHLEAALGTTSYGPWASLAVTVAYGAILLLGAGGNLASAFVTVSKIYCAKHIM